MFVCFIELCSVVCVIFSKNVFTSCISKRAASYHFFFFLTFAPRVHCVYFY